MTYLSGLMLGASLANMARQMILGTGGRPAEGNILHGLGGGLFAASERSHGTHPHVLARTEAPSAMPVSCAVPTAAFSEGKVQPPATLAKSVRRSVESLSAWIQRNTGGALDLSSLVAGIFIMRGIRQLVISNNTPSGSQMLWWALSLMRGWKV